MANLTLGAQFEDVWFPDSLGGGTITQRQSGRMVYISDTGYTVTILGRGLSYDDDGLPASGTISVLEIVRDGITYATFSNLSFDFAQAGMRLFGFPRDNGEQSGADPWFLWRAMLRGNDLINGSESHDDIRGGAGRDIIFAAGGDDFVGDEQGADTIYGGDGWDTLSFHETYWDLAAYRGVLVDAATGVAVDSWGDSNTIGGFESYRDTHFSDTLKGSDADENFWLTRGNDYADGRGGWDSVDYADVSDWGAKRGIKANLATGIVIDPWRGRDTITGIEDIAGTIFNDTMSGGDGDDQFSGNAGVDVISGGSGHDAVAFWRAETGVVINTGLAAQIQNDGFGNSETVSGIESYIGSGQNDIFIGSNLADEFNGWWRHDTLNGGGGDDRLLGDWGQDSLTGGGGNDTLYGGAGYDTLSGNGGSDDFVFDWDLVDAGVDRITDFVSGVDEIMVYNSWGGGFTSADLAANQFRSGAGVTNANSATQRFIYNTATGDLYFDADGSGSGAAATRFATLTNLAALTFADIHIFF